MPFIAISAASLSALYLTGVIQPTSNVKDNANTFTSALGKSVATFVAATTDYEFVKKDTTTATTTETGTNTAATDTAANTTTTDTAANTTTTN